MDSCYEYIPQLWYRGTVGTVGTCWYRGTSKYRYLRSCGTYGTYGTYGTAVPVPSKSITRRPDIARVVILLDLVLLVFSVVVFYRF